MRNSQDKYLIYSSIQLFSCVYLINFLTYLLAYLLTYILTKKRGHLYVPTMSEHTRTFTHSATD